MIPFHDFFPDLAQREVRCVHLGSAPEATPEIDIPADEYIYLEFYCNDPACDCRRVFLQVVGRNSLHRVLASINDGWEKESFYRKRLPFDPDAPRQITRGELDPLNEQSQFAEAFLDLFQKFVLDEPYRLRLRRHYRLFREELARRNGQPPQSNQPVAIPGPGKKKTGNAEK